MTDNKDDEAKAKAAALTAKIEGDKQLSIELFELLGARVGVPAGDWSDTRERTMFLFRSLVVATAVATLALKYNQTWSMSKENIDKALDAGVRLADEQFKQLEAAARAASSLGAGGFEALLDLLDKLGARCQCEACRAERALRGAEPTTHRGDPRFAQSPGDDDDRPN